MALIDKLTAIADAIRAKTGSTEEMTLTEMAAAVAGIQTGGGPLPFTIVSDIPANHVVVMVEGIEITTECIEEVEEENVDV